MKPSQVTKLHGSQEHTGSASADRVQRAIKGLVSFLRRLVFADGRLLDGGNNDGSGPGLVISNTATTINHGLGRPVRGFWTIYMRDAGDVPFLSTVQPQDPTKQVNLEAANPVTVKLWVW